MVNLLPKSHPQPASSFSSLQPLHPPADTENEFEALVIGTSLHHRISTVRRFFCLLAAFDVLFMFLIWVIYIKIRYAEQSYADAFSQEVLNYTVKESLFDIVVLSLLRLILLLAAYCVFILSSCWMVLLTTSISTAFLIFKVFMYEWSQSAAVLLPVILLILSFVLAWVETWFLDIKVLPSERRASKLLARYINQTMVAAGSSHPAAASSIMSEDEYFYSPPASEAGSIRDEEPGDSVSVDIDIHEQNQSLAQDQSLAQKLEQTRLQGLQLLSSENWKTERIRKGLIIQSMKLPQIEKCYKYVGTLEASLDQVRLIFKSLMRAPGRWLEMNIPFAFLLCERGEGTAMIHITCPAQTLVADRDFTCGCRLYLQDQRAVLTIKSVPSELSQETHISGYIHQCLFVFDFADSRCHFQWLLSVSLKGLLPEFMRSRETTKIMLNFISYLHQQVEELQSHNPPAVAVG